MRNSLLSVAAAAIILTLNLFALNTSAPTGKIQSLAVEDAPHDDGSGIMLSWKPLPRSQRIIQYRIYRGISPDTLFFFGQVEVDPVAGVAADKMFYYDKDYQNLLTIDSPARLKKEKQQSPDSPLYRAVPRDPAILKRLLPHFTVLGIVDQANLYKHSVRVINPDSTVAAGLRPTEFEQLAANPVAGNRYYYTVLAVNEKGEFLPPAHIASAVPEDNPPENSARLEAVYLTDTKEFRLQWTPPITSADIYTWQFYLLPKSLAPQAEAWTEKDGQDPSLPPSWLKQATKLAEKPNDYCHYLTVPTQDGKIPGPGGQPGTTLPSGDMANSVLVLATQDYSGFTAYSKPVSPRLMSSSQLPDEPLFTVADKPDDKGDTNTLSFGQPIIFITKAAFVNQARTKVRINYEVSDNINYKIEAISFRVYNASGELIKTIGERYPDKSILLRLSKTQAGLSEIRLRMAFRYRGEDKYTDYFLAQDLTYDARTFRFQNLDVYYQGRNLSKYYYQVFRKNLLESGYYPAKKISTISRSYDDIVNFETTLDRLVTGVDEKTGTLLLEPNLTFALDEQSGLPLSVNIFRAEEQKQLDKMRAEVASLKRRLKTQPDQADSLSALITQQETYLNALLNHPVYKTASKVNNPRKWFNLFHREQLKNSRTYIYQILKTDNAAAYVLSGESKPSLPVSNWFNRGFLAALIASVVFAFIVLFTSYQARRSRDLYLRPIAGLQEIDNAVGRATEMGRPILYVPGWSTIGEITTIASMMILNKVAKKAAEYDTRIMVPNNDYYVMPLAQEMVREAFFEAGRPDSYNQVDIFYISSDQFPWAAGVNGTMIREKTATNFYMGFFNAEALLMTETGNATGSIQIAGTDSVTQVPFFITTCDYTLIGEEFYAASAYMSKDPELVAMLKAQDYFKFLIVFFILLGAILSSLHFNWLTNAFPLE